MLILYETDAIGRPPSVAEHVAEGARSAGADVRMAPLAEAGLEDVRWADALAVGASGEGATLPREAKRWMDALGFSGWRVLRGKRGCVFPTRRPGGADTASACRMLARILAARGMATAGASDMSIADRRYGEDAATRGRMIGSTFARQGS